MELSCTGKGKEGTIVSRGSLIRVSLIRVYGMFFPHQIPMSRSARKFIIQAEIVRIDMPENL